VPFKFDALKHPRDKRGRFTKSRTVLASAKDKKAVKEITAGFTPAKTGDGKAYAGKIADPGHQSVASDFALDAKAINEDLRAGHADAAGVKPMDDAMRPLPDDVVLHRSVPATAFGSIDPQSLQGMKVRDAGFSPTQIDAPQTSDGDVHMFIAAQKGSRAVVNAETGEVYLDRDSEMVVSRVEKNSAGGHDMYMTVLPKADAKGGSSKPEPATVTEPRKSAPETKPAKPEPAGPKTPSPEPDKPAGGDEFRASLMKQTVADLQTQMRERGLKPGKKRKSELVDALVADEMGHTDKPSAKPDAKPAAKPAAPKPAPKPTVEASAEDKVLQAIHDVHNGDGSKPGDLISLAKVRDRLGGVDRAAVDAALLKLDRERKLTLEPDPDRRNLSDRAKAAAIPLGGEDKHLVSVPRPAADHGDAGPDPDLGGKTEPSPAWRTALRDEKAFLAAPTILQSTTALTLDRRIRQRDTRRVEQAAVAYGSDSRAGDLNYVTINAAVRGQNGGIDPAASEAMKQTVADLDLLISATPLRSNVVTYRGLRSPAAAIPGWRDDADNTGLEWVAEGYESTSGDEGVAREFATGQMVGGADAPSPTVARVLVPRGSAALQMSPVVSEVLLPRNGRRRVVADRGVVGGIRQVDIEMIPESGDG
jgi:hypothetical protein